MADPLPATPLRPAEVTSVTVSGEGVDVAFDHLGLSLLRPAVPEDLIDEQRFDKTAPEFPPVLDLVPVSRGVTPGGA